MRTAPAIHLHGVAEVNAASLTRTMPARRAYRVERRAKTRRGNHAARKNAVFVRFRMWVFFAIASAVFAGAMSVLAKIGIKDTDSDLATALRTVVVVAFAWLTASVAGSVSKIESVDTKSLVFLILSGVTTGASWLCYFKALQIGAVNKVTPVDKSSTVLTMLLSMIFLGEGVTVPKILSMTIFGCGVYLMIEMKAEKNSSSGRLWFVYAALSAVFASLTAILGKIGITCVESNLGVAIRTVVILIMAWTIVFLRNKHVKIRSVDRRSWIFIGLSGLATGLSWLCYYRALQDGPVSVVAPIDKLSVVVTFAFGCLVLREKFKKRAVAGLVLMVTGALSLLMW